MTCYDKYAFESCGCALCEFIKKYLSVDMWPYVGPWADPRRHYLESEEEFLERVPDGFLRWPEEHENVAKKRPEAWLVTKS